MNENQKKNTEQKIVGSPKLDPVFGKIMKEYFEAQQIKTSPELDEKVKELARDHKKKLAREGKLNNSDWLKWTQPIITPIRDLRGLFTLDGFSISNLRVVGTLLVIISIIGGLSYLVYYQYTNNSNNTKPGNLTSKQQTPAIEIPITKPSPQITTIPTPNIAENKSNKNKTDLDRTTQNKQETFIANRPEQVKTLQQEEDKVAVNKIKDLRTRGVKSTPNVTVQESVTLSNLVYVGVSHLNIEGHEIEPIDLEIEKELTDAIKSNSKWKLSLEPTNEPQAMFVKQQKDGALVLVNSSRQVLWKDSNYIENYRKDKNYIKSVVISLTENK